MTSSSDPSFPSQPNTPYPPVRVRVMRPEEISLAIDWAAAEGWNPGLHDAECFGAADPNGFFVAELHHEPIGCISAVGYGSDFGFLGLYIVRAEYRGRGYGMALWRAALEHLSGRNIGLDGVVAQQANYRKSGFALAHRNVRYGSPTSASVVRPSRNTASGTSVIHSAIVPIEQIPFVGLLEYDYRIFTAEREAFLNCWISRPDTIGRAILNAQGRLIGYAVARPCRIGYKIGPLFADSPDAADRLFVSLVDSLPSQSPLYLDIPQSNPAAVALAEQYGLAPVFETARMYTRADPGLPLDRIFGITSFELG